MKRTQTKFHSINVHGANSIKDFRNKEIIKQQIEDEDVKNSANTEKITIKTTIYFVLYLVALIRTLQIINDIVPSYAFNTAILQSLENLYENDDSFDVIDGKKTDFNSITKADHIYSWMKQTLIPGMYDANRGWQSFDVASSWTNVLAMISLTNIKIVQRRVNIERLDSSEGIYPYRWNPAGGANKTTYGAGGFKYSEADCKKFFFFNL